MTTPSAFSNSGLSISIFIPLVQGTSYVDNYTDDVSSYSHVISSDGGYASADFTVACNEMLANDWLQNGLGRHIVVNGDSAQKIWEGFVNELTVNIGGVTYSRGPLVNIANRVLVTYTELIEYPDGTVEPVTGVTSETVIAEDEDSQDKYGIWEKVVNVGEVFPDEAEYIRDLYLEENKNPEGNPSINISSNVGDISISIKCRGYIDWINAYVYNDEAENQYVYCSELIKTILGEEPNSIISTQYDKIDENLVIHATYTNDNKMAKNIINDILSLGGGSDDRWTFGIYADRKPVYSAIPTDIEYVYYRTGKMQEIQLLSGTIVKPWEVVPCKWVFIPDFLTGFNIRSNEYRKDPRVFFAEEVNFTAPDQVSISGAKVRKLEQYMAKFGLREA